MASTSPPGKISFCPDGLQCENGSHCVEFPQEEGKYYCDCCAIDSGNAQVFSGLYCQYEVTAYCTISGEFSPVLFCTNQGKCKGHVEADAKHLGCDCSTGYTGPHCQYVDGSTPEEYLYQQGAINNPAYATNDSTRHGRDNSGMGTVGIVVIIAVALFVVGAVLAIIVRRRRLHAASHVVERTKSTDGNLQSADGESLAVVKTETFDSELPAEGSYDKDDSKLSSVESGHLT